MPGGNSSIHNVDGADTKDKGMLKALQHFEVESMPADSGTHIIYWRAYIINRSESPYIFYPDQHFGLAGEERGYFTFSVAGDDSTGMVRIPPGDVTEVRFRAVLSAGNYALLFTQRYRVDIRFIHEGRSVEVRFRDWWFRPRKERQVLTMAGL